MTQAHLIALINQILVMLLILLFALWTWLREARKRRGWTIEQAAEHIEVDISTYHRWELGIQWPHPSNLAKLTTTFNIQTQDLWHDDNYDMVLTLPSGEKWVVDFKDYN